MVVFLYEDLPRLPDIEDTGSIDFYNKFLERKSIHEAPKGQSESRWGRFYTGMAGQFPGESCFFLSSIAFFRFSRASGSSGLILKIS